MSSVEVKVSVDKDLGVVGVVNSKCEKGAGVGV